MRFFTFAELCKSDTATKHGIANVPSLQERENLMALVENVLDPLRESLGRPIIVTSGYRSAALNKVTRGAANSQHTRGEAVDIVVSGLRPLQICQTVLANEIPFDQMIDEFSRWVHISFRSDGKNRGQYLMARKELNSTRYTEIWRNKE